ncbi:MAG: hypothetical protein A2579_00730 [Lysobacterales bacterium RIFOXYD1_FULL_69_11]|nr:MAG: hypothetical protein A2190_06500 [Xanthomonadales bacterium RIFOXYA1_FULL_69_10]OHE86402.1 MAG: hypothetical protein A2579_00730 [Xanthomonadales bacterium RIFOXYD1_FULL_69_11]
MALRPLGVSAHDAKAPGQEMERHDMSSMKGHSAGPMQLHDIMSAGMKMPMEMSGNVDKDFAMMMTMHHGQAIKMIDAYAKHGQNPDLKALAAEMKAAQLKEIETRAPHTK